VPEPCGDKDQSSIPLRQAKLALRQTVEPLTGRVDWRPHATVADETAGGGARTDWPLGCYFLRAAETRAAAYATIDPPEIVAARPRDCGEYPRRKRIAGCYDDEDRFDALLTSALCDPCAVDRTGARGQARSDRWWF